MPQVISHLLLSQAFMAASCGVFIVAGTMLAPAHAQGNGAVEMPKDAAALMKMVAQRNTLETDSMKPWKLVIHVQAASPVPPTPGAPQGDAGKSEGALSSSREIQVEEIWMNNHRSKTTFRTGDHTWQIYDSDSGPMIVGEAEKKDFWSRAMGEYVGPIADEKIRAMWMLAQKDQVVGSAKLRCVSITGFLVNGEKRATPGQTFCMDEDKPSLRLTAESNGHTQTVHNGLRVIAGQYLPERVEMVRGGASVWKAQLVSFETLDHVDEASLVAPPQAKSIPRRIAISSSVAAGQIVNQTRPEYPPVAKAQGVSGTVVIEATIGKDGKVTNLDVVSGPKELQSAAVEAVERWRYKPYLLNGDPVEVDTTINVVFQLGH